MGLHRAGERHGLVDADVQPSLSKYFPLVAAQPAAGLTEVILRGEVTAIGGLKEKLLAALRGGIRTVLIPEENVKDLQEIPDNVKSGLEIVPVKWIDKVLEIALERKPVPLTDEEVAAAAVVAAAADKAAAVPTAESVKH